MSSTKSNKKEINFLHSYVSVDCVVFGFDGDDLNVLLVERAGKKSLASDKKLPGSLVYHEEDTDQAAERVLEELTGIKKMKLKQFKCFSSVDRTDNPDDVKWLEKEYGSEISRLITVAYLSLTKIGRKLNVVSKYKSAQWCAVSEVGNMPFDHNRIVEESLIEIREWISREPAILFELLPAKFTISQLRHLYETIDQKNYDVRNFYKKIGSLDYIVALEKYQKDVSHRAARYYRFDKVLYNKRMAAIS